MPWKQLPPDPDPRDPHRIDMPFELRPEEEPLDLSDGLASGGVVVLSAVQEAPDGGRIPCIVYRFARPDGTGFYPPISLVMDEADMSHLKVLTNQAINAAIRAARS